DPFLERLFGQLHIEGGASGTRALRLRGDPVRLAAKARPPGMASGDWLPAQHLAIEDAWQPPGGVIAVGVPVTRHLRISAVGLGASQLPDLSALAPWPSGLKAHPDEPKLVDEVQDGHIVGHREQDIVLLADRAGRFELPALRVGWWDVVTHQRREAVLPAHTLEVVPGAHATPMLGAAAAAASSGASDASAAAPPVQQTATSSPSSADVPAPSSTATLAWVWISVALGLLWLATLGAWAWTHRRRRRAGHTGAPTQATEAPGLSAATARRAFQQACRDHNAQCARDALLAWARATGPDNAPAGLNALARRLGRADLTPLLRDLDRACLDGTAWNGEALARAMPSLDREDRPDKAPQNLPGLYDEQ
ncbi:MAG: protein BatD, partial [Pseudomonadota bacterium]|nr:protein BatD [Pseudomonadota bacterium]